MHAPDELSLFVERLEAVGAPHMVTGATAAILYGQPRVTNDLDIVLSLNDTDRSAFLAAFPESDFYVPPESVIRTEQARLQRNSLAIKPAHPNTICLRLTNQINYKKFALPMKYYLRQLSWFAPVAFAVAVHAAQTNPRPIETPSPVYPAALTDTGKDGTATIEVIVQPDGSVGEASLASADHEAFGEAALAAVKLWRFEPATLDGKPVQKRVTIPFKFSAPVAQQLNARFKRKIFQEIPERVLTAKEYGKKLKATKPLKAVYPPAGKGAQANVQVKFVVAPDGSTINPDIIGKPPKQFLLPAILAISNAAYEPPMKDGKPVYVEMTAKLAFEPPQRAARGGGGGGGDFGGGGGGGGGSPDE